MTASGEVTIPTISKIDLEAALAVQLEPFSRYISGSPLAVVLVVKGQPGVAETAGQPPFAGVDGEALAKALLALGWGEDRKAVHSNLTDAAALGVLLRPVGALPLTALELRELIEIVDPVTVVALDQAARTALVEAFSSSESGFLAEFSSGTAQMVLGRRFVSVDGFEASLADSHKKQLAWAQLKQAKRPERR
jgi:hypothetical protein